MRRRHLAVLFSLAVLACATTPEPRPVDLDPSNPEAPRAPPLEPLEAFATGPQGLDEPLLPPVEVQGPPEGEPPAHGHEGHEEHDGHQGHQRQEGHEQHQGPEGGGGHEGHAP